MGSYFCNFYCLSGIKYEFHGGYYWSDVISPLMGPIMGFGLGLGMDTETMKPDTVMLVYLKSRKKLSAAEEEKLQA